MSVLQKNTRVNFPDILKCKFADIILKLQANGFRLYFPK